MTYESNDASCCRGYIDGSIHKSCSLYSVTIRMMINHQYWTEGVVHTRWIYILLHWELVCFRHVFLYVVKWHTLRMYTESFYVYYINVVKDILCDVRLLFVFELLYHSFVTFNGPVEKKIYYESWLRPTINRPLLFSPKLVISTLKEFYI